MAVTVDGLKITLTAEEGGIGSSEENPYTFDDLMDDAVNITKSTSIDVLLRNFYYVPYSIFLSGIVYFSSINEIVLFGEDVDTVGSRLNSTSSGYWNLNKSMWRCNNSEFSHIYNFAVEDCAFMDFRGFSFYSGTLNKVKFVNVGSTYFSLSTNVSLIDCENSSGVYGNIPRNNITDIRNKYLDCTYGMLLGYNTYAMKIYNPQVINCTYDLCFQPLRNTNSLTTIIDGLIDTDNIRLLVSLGPYGDKNRCMTLNLATNMSFEFENADNANVKVFDKDASLLFDETYVEDLEEEINYYERYVESQGIVYNPAVDEITIRQPFSIVVSKDGYDDLEINNVNVVPGEATSIRGTLVPSTAPIYVNQSISGLLEDISISGDIELNNITGTVSQNIITGSIINNTIESSITNSSIT
jgi:hypothetical protein